MRRETNVLIYYSKFATVIGGGEYLPLLMASEFQKRGCHVVMAVSYDTLVAQVAKLYGIPLDVGSLRVVQLKPRGKLRRKIDSILPVFSVKRLKALAKDADLCISTQNIIDFGKPAHHFICDVQHGQFGDTAFSDYVHGHSYGRLYRLYRTIRYWFAESILRPMFQIRSTRKIAMDKRERLYPNSVYVDELLHGFYGDVNSFVYYPPTIFTVDANAEWRDPFLVKYIGRIHPSKGILNIIEIVDRVRSITGKDLKLDIAGPLIDSEYVAKVRSRVSSADWVCLAGCVHGDDKMRFLSRGTYAIHAQRDETFGISVTEYLKAGNIVIVPNEGGSKEIVDSPELTYDTEKEAVQMLTRLLSDEIFREEMRRHCIERAQVFSREAYMERQRELVDNLLGAL